MRQGFGGLARWSREREDRFVAPGSLAFEQPLGPSPHAFTMTSTPTTDHAIIDVTVQAPASQPAAPGASEPGSEAVTERQGTAGARARIAYQPSLDGVRGVGLFFVVASHAGFEFARGGFLWVSSFFTLSGYLITSLLVAEHQKHGSVSATAFWARRFRRLMPAAVVTLLVVCGFGLVFADASQLSRLRGDGLSALFYMANWHFIFSNTAYADLFASPSPVQHFWTLSIEEQFYLFFPLLLVFGLWLGRGKWRVVAAVVGAMTVASVAWMLYLASTGADTDRLYFGTDTRFPELALGVLLGVGLGFWQPRFRLTTDRLVKVLGLVALGVVLIMTFTVSRTDAWLYKGGLALYACLSCLLVFTCIHPGSWTGRILSFKPIVGLGMLSYTAYLIHWPTFLVLSPERTKMAQVPLFGLRCAVTVGLAYGVYRFVERPVRSGERIRGRIGVIAVPLSFLVVCVGLVAVTWDPPPPPLDLAGDDQVDPPKVAPGATKVMIVGDSQAWVLGNALRRWAEAHPTEAAVWDAAGRGCGIVRGGTTIRLGTEETGVCEDWDVQWANKLERFDPDVVMVMSSGWDWVPRKLSGWDDFKKYGDPTFDAHMVEEYKQAAELLSSKGAQVVWLTNACYELEGFSTDDPRHGNDKLLPQVAAAQPKSVRIYDFFADLCPNGTYTRDVGGDPNGRPDGLHLSDKAADVEAAKLMPLMIGVSGTTPPGG